MEPILVQQDQAQYAAIQLCVPWIGAIFEKM